MQTIPHGGSAIPPIFERAGYTRTGWSAPYTNVTGNVTITAVWTVNVNTIIFNANGGTGTMSSQALATNATASLTQNAFTRIGHTFQGWATSVVNANAGTIAYADEATFTMGTAVSTTLFAVWSVNMYHITFTNLLGGAANNPTTFTINDLPLTLASASRLGWEFIGWYDALTGGSAVTMIFAVGDVTLYARWAEQPTVYTITFRDADANDITFTVLDLNNNPIVLTNAEREGYTFLGWFTADGEHVTQITEIGNITLFARWESDSEPFMWWLLGATLGVGVIIAIILWLALIKKKMLGGR